MTRHYVVQEEHIWWITASLVGAYQFLQTQRFCQLTREKLTGSWLKHSILETWEKNVLAKLPSPCPIKNLTFWKARATIRLQMRELFNFLLFCGSYHDVALNKLALGYLVCSWIHRWGGVWATWRYKYSSLFKINQLWVCARVVCLFSLCPCTCLRKEVMNEYQLAQLSVLLMTTSHAYFSWTVFYWSSRREQVLWNNAGSGWNARRRCRISSASMYFR